MQHKAVYLLFCDLTLYIYINFYCYAVHVVELLNYYTNHCTYIKSINLHIKTLKTLRHVSVLRPASRSYIFLAKVTLEIVTD